jgi:hypothetical protein
MVGRREEDSGIEPLRLQAAVQRLASVPSTHTGSVLLSRACHDQNCIRLTSLLCGTIERNLSAVPVSGAVDEMSTGLKAVALTQFVGKLQPIFFLETVTCRGRRVDKAGRTDFRGIAGDQSVARDFSEVPCLT